MGFFKTYELTFNVDKQVIRDALDRIQSKKINISVLYGEHLEFIYLEGFGEKPTMVVSVYTGPCFTDPDRGGLSILLDKLGIDISQVTCNPIEHF